MTNTPPLNSNTVIEQDMRHWLERAVIGLNLCPFAKSVHIKGQIHYAVSRAGTPHELLEDLAEELKSLMSIQPSARTTTLLMAPDCLSDFQGFNDFLAVADALVEDLELEGTIQLASFHPQFQFAGTAPDDITNSTNRAPYPTLHLLREDSIDLAVEAFPDAGLIFERNIKTLEELGHAGWAALDVGRSNPADSDPALPHRNVQT